MLFVVLRVAFALFYVLASLGCVCEIFNNLFLSRASCCCVLLFVVVTLVGCKLVAILPQM